jgi:MFS family permease
VVGDPNSAGTVWDRQHRVLTIGLILTVSMAAFENLAVATILPATVADIGGLPLYGWTFSAFMLAEIIAISIAGRAGDTHGLARPFAVGGALFCAGLVSGGLAASMPILIASRALQGLGGGTIAVLAYAATARGYGEGARPRMLALISTAWVVPGLIGPALAGAIAEHASWRWVFLGLAPLSAVAVALAVRALRNVGPALDAAAHGATGAAAGLAAGAAALLVAPGLDSAAAAVALGAVAAIIAATSLRHLTPPGTLRARPGLPAAVAAMGLLSAAFFSAEVFIPLALTDVRSRSVTIAGLALTAATITWTTGAWLQARLVPHRSRRALVAVGLLVMAAGIAGVSTILLPAVPVALAPIAWGVAGLGMGLAYSTTALVVLECAPRGEEGAASAAMQLTNVLGTALGTGVGGVVLARVTTAGGSIAAAIALTDVIALLAAAGAAATALRLPGLPKRD